MNFESLSSLCDVKNGYAFKSKDYIGSGYRVIRISNVQKGVVVDKDPKFISEEIADNLPSYKLIEGDILISLTGNVGRVGIINVNHLPAVLNQRVGLIRPSSKLLYDKYLFHYLNSSSFEQKAIKNSSGAAQLNLSSKWIEQHKILLPTLQEQHQIAYVLGKVETLIYKRNKNMVQVDQLLNSLFLDMFGPTNEAFEKWPLVEIKDLAEAKKGSMRTGPFGSNLLHSEFVDEGEVAVLGIDNAVKNKFSWKERRYITAEKYKELKAYTIKAGDVIVTIMGTIGRSAVIPEDIPVAINTKHLAAITLNKEVANPQFISYSIHSSPYILQQFKSKNRGAIMSGLNLTIIKETKLRLPPISQQNKFSEIYKKLEALRSSYQESLDQLRNLYDSLSQKAFKGELDLSRITLTVAEHENDVLDDDGVNNKDTNLDVKESIKNFSSNTNSQKDKLIKLMDNYLQGMEGMSFNLNEFWQTNRLKIRGEMTELDDFRGIDNYEVLKEYIFTLIGSGKLEQVFDEEKKQLLLRVTV